MNNNEQGLARRDFLRVAGISGIFSLFNIQHRLARSPAGDHPQEVSAAKGNRPKFPITFESFVVGSCNRFAHAAAWAVAQSQARVYNPLFLHGAGGTGKTHLMHAISSQAHEAWPANFIYFTGQGFTDGFVNAIKNNRLGEWRTWYREVDLLLLDGIQWLVGRETQEEFLHLFKARFDKCKQIVLSGLGRPSETANLDPRLATRFEWGLTAELHPPDVETRRAIRQKQTHHLRAMQKSAAAA